MLRVLAQASQFLSSRPTATRICQFLVLHLDWPIKARSAALARCTKTGDLLLEGTFGVAADLAQSYHRMPLFEGTPMADSVITSAPVVVHDTTEMSARYPTVCSDLQAHKGYSPTSSLIAVPLLSYVGPAGSCGIFFEDAGDDLDDLVRMVEAVASLLVLSVDDEPEIDRVVMSSPKHWLDQQYAANDSGNSHSTALTQRQTQVLLLMAERRKNHEIADVMGYSESTIRMEATSIFRALGVKSRHDAVMRARDLGLIP